MYLLDSNILIGFLNENKEVVNWISEKKQKDAILAFSVISKIEVLSFAPLTAEQVSNTEKFLNLFRQFNLNDEVVSLSSALRRKANISLGDAMIVATAISYRMILVTNDKQLATKVKGLIEVISI